MFVSTSASDRHWDLDLWQATVVLEIRHIRPSHCWPDVGILECGDSSPLLFPALGQSSNSAARQYGEARPHRDGWAGDSSLLLFPVLRQSSGSAVRQYGEARPTGMAGPATRRRFYFRPFDNRAALPPAVR